MDTSLSLRLLIVEDDAVDRKLLERLLAQSSLGACQVESADRLVGALDLLRDHPCDIILLDLGLPDSQGIDSVVRLQACAPQTPIIVLSGLDDADVATQAVQIGVQDYLIKGQVDAHLLMRAIRYARERKKAERQLQAAELRYRTIFENSAVGIMLVDEQHQLVSWNKFTEQLLGMTRDQLFGRQVQEFYPEPEWQKIRALSIRRKGMEHHLETKMIRGDGSLIDVDISLSVVRDSEGKVTGSIGVVQDIRERLRVHEILDRKQKNLEAIFDAAPVGMLLVNQQMRVVRANDTIRQIFGKAYPDVIEHDACEALGCLRGSDATAGADCPSCLFRSKIQMVLASGAPVRGLEIQPRLNHEGDRAQGDPKRDLSRLGTQPWLSLSVEPVNIDGAKHVVVALNDVTDRKRAEEQLKDTMEMKSQFISTVSHELRTPMTAMQEAVIIVLDEIAGKLNKDQKHFLDVAKRNLDRLSRLIDDVLDLQKLNAGKMKFHMQANDMAAAVKEAYATMQPHAAKSKVDLAIELEPNLPEVVYDSDRIIQALTNLISNGIKFTPEGGRVLVSACRRQGLPNAKGGVGDPGEHLAIKVSDTGYGIPKEDLPKLFDQFFRVHRPGKEIKGTGLGLAIVSKIVAGHGGRIEVESELDKGTTFTVLLPVAPQHAEGGTSDGVDRHLEDVLTGS